MAALDAAIHEKHNTFNMLLDGRVKPGHDSGGHTMLFPASSRGNDSQERRLRTLDIKLG
jgi:hypothetical protein